MIPPYETGGDQHLSIEETVAALDGIVLAGGEDLGENALRDRAELALLGAALDHNLPVLAICRGHQLLNVHLGGSLVAHLPDLTGSEAHRPAPGRFGHVTIATEPGSLIASLAADTLAVPCHHHQAIDALGKGLVVTARSEDRVVEAVELSGAGFVLGVQWHPEEDAEGSRGLFAGFVEAAAGHSALSRPTR